MHKYKTSQGLRDCHIEQGKALLKKGFIKERFYCRIWPYGKYLCKLSVF